MLLDTTSAESTKSTNKSHMAYWSLYCDHVGLDEYAFALDSDPCKVACAEEEGVLIAFKQYVVCHPRDTKKKKAKGTTAGNNTVAYAEQCVSSVRSWYERRCKRQIGVRDARGWSSRESREISKALSKIQGDRADPRPPILADDMLALRAECDLEDDLVDVLMFAIANLCWADIKRVGDLLPDPAEVAKGWNPANRLHRGRVTIRRHGRKWHDIIIDHKPPKNDPTGFHRHESVLTTGPEHDLLNPANNLKRYLLRDGDPASVDASSIPLFRHPKTKKEVTKEQFRSWLSRKFTAAGRPQFVGCGHSLRIGGATTLFALEGPEAVKALGGWTSEVYRIYIHLSREQRRKYVRLMGRQTSSATVPARNAPLGRV